MSTGCSAAKEAETSQPTAAKSPMTFISLSLKVHFQGQLNGAGGILLILLHGPECSIGGIRGRRGEPWMVERVVCFEAELHLQPFRWLEVLIDPQVHLIDAAHANVAPRRRDGADPVGEILVDAVLDRVPGLRHIARARKALNARPRWIGRQNAVLVRIHGELRSIEPLREGALVARDAEILTAEKEVAVGGVRVEVDRRARLNGVLARQLPSARDEVQRL